MRRENGLPRFTRPVPMVQSKDEKKREGVASVEVVAATTDPATAALARRVAATCGAPTAGVRGWDSSRNGGSENHNQSSPSFLVDLSPPPFHKWIVTSHSV
ncbi:hypothetical protein AVEN_89063-1 [Araneus ventricosus]|uniref:Uncharacterized protein n=1 Tax=Araneus ventricosus TaxID=182803 RepID=A0A4Y2B0Y1_ARAVE|nr:hypothetical protein AVEN_89063-1 [Araneus ventricosus]